MNFSEFYDLFQADVDYEALINPILPCLNKDEVILDAGCGSGYILAHLVNLGYDVIGIDRDEAMLERAHKKISTYGYSKQLFLHDLKYPLKQKFHQMIALLDVFHYFKGIKNLAKNLYNALYDGGILIIDLYQGPQDYTESGKIEGFKYHWEMSTVHNILMHKITVKKGKVESHYMVRQYVYNVDYYVDVLKAVGFTIQIFSGFDDRKIYLVCTK